MRDPAAREGLRWMGLILGGVLLVTVVVIVGVVYPWFRAATLLAFLVLGVVLVWRRARAGGFR